MAKKKEVPSVPGRHFHPSGSGETIFGLELDKAEAIRKGDFYSSQDGYWKPAPEDCLGLLVGRCRKNVWVRPTEEK